MVKNKKQTLALKRGLLFAGIAILLIGAATAALLVSQGAAKQCTPTSMPVSLSEGAEDRYTVAGELCWRGSLEDKVVQVLISGHTYDRTYWDFPVQPETYSYVDAAIGAGYATFNFDRVGVGESDIPSDPALLTTPSNAHVVHQLVEALRSGNIANTSFSKVVLVGHSLGGAIALYAAGTYGDADAVVMTGSLGDTNPAFIQTLNAEYVYPAKEDPKFASENLADGYVTTRPGERGNAFYNTDYADEAVIEVDDAAKQPGTVQSIITIALARGPEIAGQLKIPVFYAQGEVDALYCDANNPDLPCDTPNAVIEREKPYLPQACLDAYVQPNAGHDGALHPNAPAMFAAVNNWLATWVGETAADTPAESC